MQLSLGLFNSFVFPFPRHFQFYNTINMNQLSLKNGLYLSRLAHSPTGILNRDDLQDLTENNIISAEVVNTMVYLLKPINNDLSSGSRIYLDAQFLSNFEGLAEADRYTLAVTAPPAHLSNPSLVTDIIIPFCIANESSLNGHWVTVVLRTRHRVWTVRSECCSHY